MKSYLTKMLAFLLVFILGISFIGLYRIFFQTRSLPAAKLIVDVAPGSTFAGAALQLERANICSAPLLRILAKLEHREADIQAGALVFPAHETLTEILDRLTSHAQRASVLVTIPEGDTAAQIERRLVAANVRGAIGFATYAKRHHVRIGTARSATLEGFLFPDTYLIGRDAKVAEIAQIMTREFEQHLPPDAQRQASALGFTVPQVVTVASLIEREAQVDAERPVMAGIYYHRLAIGMPLEVDATLEYLLPVHETAIRMSDLRKDTPYNSYLHPGLPPTPIANPGLASIRAALHPMKTAYLYYVYKGGGRHAFAETYEGHKANITHYLR